MASITAISAAIRGGVYLSRRLLGGPATRKHAQIGSSFDQVKEAAIICMDFMIAVILCIIIHVIVFIHCYIPFSDKINFLLKSGYVHHFFLKTIQKRRQQHTNHPPSLMTMHDARFCFHVAALAWRGIFAAAAAVGVRHGRGQNSREDQCANKFFHDGSFMLKMVRSFE